jgi:hypothetical protein
MPEEYARLGSLVPAFSWADERRRATVAKDAEPQGHLNQTFGPADYSLESAELEVDRNTETSEWPAFCPLAINPDIAG